MKTVLGIDPGAHDAVAVLDDGGYLLEVLDTPSTLEANGRTATNAPLLAGVPALVASSKAAPARFASRSCF